LTNVDASPFVPAIKQSLYLPPAREKRKSPASGEGGANGIARFYVGDPTSRPPTKA
jgi:hypothetical protein